MISARFARFVRFLRFLRFLMMLCALVPVSCALPTGSGQPELMLPVSQRAAFTSHFTNAMLDARYSIADQGPDFIVFEPMGAEGLMLMAGSRTPRPRIRLSYVESGDIVRVVASRNLEERNVFESVGGTASMLANSRGWLQGLMNKSAGQ